MYRIDGLQYANWSPKIFKQMQQAKMDAVHVTIAYHENFRETVANISQWNRWFETYPELIFQGFSAADIKEANKTNRTAIFFGAQNCSPMEDDIGLVEVLHQLGMRFMQLSYNNQSLLASGCYESHDNGIGRMGKQVIKEMNRVGLVVDMSHSADESTIQAADISKRPIVITHANPFNWAPVLRNKKDAVIRSVINNGGMLGFSLYPHHLKNKSDCTLIDFCQMVADIVEKFGIKHFAIGSDLCQDHPDSVVEWMRVGRWSKEIDYGEGSANNAGFMPMPDWFMNNLGFNNLEKGLLAIGFNADEVASIIGNNWFNFFDDNFKSQN